MPQIIEVNFDEQYLLPPSLEDWVNKDHPARLIREFVESVDLAKLDFRQPLVGEVGRPSYAAALLTRVWLYGYYEKVRSSRQLEWACRERMGFAWLCGNQVPDHNTLWRFWRDNKKPLRELFKKTVKVAMELNLVGMVLQAVDGTKIQAACSGRGGFDRKSLERLLERLDEEIEKLEKSVEQEPRQTVLPKAAAGEGIGSRQELRQKVAAALKAVEQNEAKHVHPGEPQARRMGCDGKNRFGYNAQAMVDQKSRVIVAAEVVNDPTDTAQLNPMIEEASVNTCRKNTTTLADGGYVSGAQLQKAQQMGREVLSPLPASSQNPDDNPYHASNFRHDAERDVVVCPQGQVIPFQRERRRRGQITRVYRSAKTCRDCPVRALCTKDRHGRTIDVPPSREILLQHGRRMKEPLPAALYRLRAEIVEPVFGWIKEQMRFRRWTAFGIQNARTQWAMICSACNLRTIYRYWKLARAG